MAPLRVSIKDKSLMCGNPLSFQAPFNDFCDYHEILEENVANNTGQRTRGGRNRSGLLGALIITVWANVGFGFIVISFINAIYGAVHMGDLMGRFLDRYN